MREKLGWFRAKLLMEWICRQDEPPTPAEPVDEELKKYIEARRTRDIPEKPQK